MNVKTKGDYFARCEGRRRFHWTSSRGMNEVGYKRLAARAAGRGGKDRSENAMRKDQART